MIFCIEDLMGHPFAFEEFADDFVFFNRRRAYQYRLSAFVALHDISNNRRILCSRRFIHAVGKILPNHGAVRRNDDNIQVIYFMEFLRFSSCCSGHTGQFLIHAEIILQGYSRQRLTFLLNRDIFLCFYCLMDAFGKPPADKESPRKLINNDDLVILYDIILLPLKECPCFQRRLDMVNGCKIFLIYIRDT